MDYIEREPLLKIAKSLQGNVFGTALIIKAIENAPAIDVKKDMVEEKELKLSDLKQAVKCCTSPSSEWEDTCGSCPLNKGAKDFEEMTDVANCIDALIFALTEYLPEDESDESDDSNHI